MLIKFTYLFIDTRKQWRVYNYINWGDTRGQSVRYSNGSHNTG